VSPTPPAFIPDVDSLERYSEGVTICTYYPSFGSPEVLSIQPGKVSTQSSSGSDTAMNLMERLRGMDGKGKKARKTQKTRKNRNKSKKN